jgi:nucleotide-binding universal stress UspA family protein
MSTESVTPRGDQVRRVGEFQRILVATDFSQTARRALDYAHALCARSHAKLFLVHVVPREFHFVPPESFPEAIATANRYALKETAELVAAAKLEDVNHQEIVAEGRVWPILQEIIRSEHIDLIAFGTHGRTSNGKLNLGSVAEEIFRLADCPVLTVGKQGNIATGAKAEFRSLLYATNFKPHSEHASGAAYFLEREHGAHLSVLHVVEGASAGFATGNKILLDFLVKRMRKTMPSECQGQCEPDFLVRFGEPGEEILQTARDSGANLIVLGMRRSGKLSGCLPSAVAYRVVCQAPCPVLTLRH